MDSVQQPSNYFKTMKNETKDKINGITRNYLKKSGIFFFKSFSSLSEIDETGILILSDVLVHVKVITQNYFSSTQTVTTYLQPYH